MELGYHHEGERLRFRSAENYRRYTTLNEQIQNLNKNCPHLSFVRRQMNPICALLVDTFMQYLDLLI